MGVAYRVEIGVGVGREVEDVADDAAVGGVEAGLASPPHGLQDVLHRVFRARPEQQR